MRAVPSVQAKERGNVPKHRDFWHRLLAAVDSLAAYPVRHALSEREIRQVDDEIERCRQLMPAQRPQQHGGAVVLFPAPPRRIFAPVKVLAPVKVRR